MNIDLDVNNYSHDELLGLLNITSQYDENSLRNIIVNVHKDLKKNISNKTQRKEIIQFFNNVEKKLLLNMMSTQDDDDTDSSSVSSYDSINDVCNVLQSDNADYNKSSNNYGMNVTIDKVNNQPNYDLMRNPKVLSSQEHNTIIHKNIPINDVYNNKIPAGIINPIRRQTLTQIVNIDSIFRKNYESTKSNDFIYNFSVPMNNIVSMKLTSLEMPNIWHTFSAEKESNIFYITVQNLNPGLGIPNKKHKVEIPQGSYTPKDFETAMNNYFTSYVDIDNGTMPLAFLKLQISPFTGQIIIRAQDISDTATTNPKPYNILNSLTYSPNFSFILDFALENNNRSITQNAGWMMGFRESMYIVDPTYTYTTYIKSTTKITYKGYITSEGIFGSSVLHYFYLSIDDFNKNFKNSIISENENSYLGDSILGRISVRTGAMGVIMDDPSDRIFKQRDYFGPVKIEKIRVQIFDKYGSPIGLGDNDYSFTLEMTHLYS